MKAPEFWFQPNAPLGKLLSPLGYAYRLAGALNGSRTRPARVDATVICVGNLVAGGAGKTPVAMSIAETLKHEGLVFLTRGYGGRQAGPVRVSPQFHTSADVGDEALLLARTAPTWIARDRAAGAIAAIKDGAQLIVMDDGYQNPSLTKDIGIVVVDGETGFGNGRIIPAGPLREPLVQGLARADAMVIVGDDHTGTAKKKTRASLPVLSGRILAAVDQADWSGRRVVAFAGIGRPEKFFDTLDTIGCEVVASHAFADHHAYSHSEIARICAEADAGDATPITTEKDAVRLPSILKDRVEALPVKFVWDDPAALEDFLTKKIDAANH